MPKVPDHIMKQSLGAPGSNAGNGEAIMASIKAAAGFAAAAYDVGDTLNDIHKEHQNLANKKTLLTSRQELEAAVDENSFAAMQDKTTPENWVANFDEASKNWKSEFQKRNLAPVVRDQLMMDANQIVGSARRKIGQASLQANASQTRQIYGDEVNRQQARGNFDGSIKRLDEMKGLGLIDEADYKQKVFEVENSRARFALDNLIAADPDGAAEEINDPDFIEKHPHLTLADHDSLKRNVTIAQNNSANEFWTQVAEDSVHPYDPKILSLDELDDLMKAGKITPSQRVSYVDAYHDAGQPDPAPDPATYDSALGLIRQYDPATDPTKYGLANLRAMIGTLRLPKEHVSELGKALTKQAGDGSGSGGGVHKEITKNFAAFTDELWEQGTFGKWWIMSDHDNNAETIERKTITYADYTAAMSERAAFVIQWENYLRSAPDDLDPTAATAEFNKMVEDRTNTGPSKLTPPAQPGARTDLDKAVDAVIGGPPTAPEALPPVGTDQRAKNPDAAAQDAADNPTTEEDPTAPADKTAAAPKRGGIYTPRFSTTRERRAIQAAGGTAILLDTNYSGSGQGITAPLVVYPDNATPAQKAASLKYAQQMNEFLNAKLGRKNKGTIRSRTENQRGRSNAFHTEPYALTDQQAVKLMSSPAGMEAHRRILKSTLGALPGARYFLPHSATDPGAKANGTTEVRAAKDLLLSFPTDLPKQSLKGSRHEAHLDWFDYAKPTSPEEIQNGLRELDLLRSISRHG